LRVTSENRALGTGYDPSPWSALRQAMKLAAVNAQGMSFVDIGCGKGRIVLAAMAYPFKDIVGIDYSPTLCDIATTTAAPFFLRCGIAICFMVPRQVVGSLNQFEFEPSERWKPRPCDKPNRRFG
jgi:SAM-dependent methyltransferase